MKYLVYSLVMVLGGIGVFLLANMITPYTQAILYIGGVTMGAVGVNILRRTAVSLNL